MFSSPGVSIFSRAPTTTKRKKKRRPKTGMQRASTQKVIFEFSKRKKSVGLSHIKKSDLPISDIEHEKKIGSFWHQSQNYNQKM